MDRPTTLRELRASGWRSRSVKDEVRANLIARQREGRPLFPGIVGFDATVVPQIENAILARHDFILLGLRGQAKSRILRGLVDLLDPWLPVVADGELNDDPLAPVSRRARRLLAEQGDDLAIDWIPAERRYQEKLATPDVTVADLIGDIDPIKAAVEKRNYADEETIHHGIVPRANRGIFAVNELPDLPARIQVAFLDILEERDIQIRGFPVRLPLDLLVVFTANPEDYTNRGTIITPLKDRIDSQILTHYPRTAGDALAITRQEAWRDREGGPEIALPELIEVAIEEAVFEARRSEFVDPASGVSQRAAISALECVVSNAERRAVLTGSSRAVVRLTDLHAAVPALVGKMELVYEGEQQGTVAVARRVLGTAIRSAFEARLPPFQAVGPRGRRPDADAAPEEVSDPYRPILGWFAEGHTLEVRDTTSDEEHREALDAVRGLRDLVEAHADPTDADETTLLMELTLEGLHQSAALARDDLDGGASFADMLKGMLAGMEADEEP